MMGPVLPSFAQTGELGVPVRDITQEQVSEAQLRAAVASRTLTWLTGNSANNDYVSVGRIANFFGFVGLRVASGQSLSRSAVAHDTLAILTDAQRAELIALGHDQAEALSQTHAARTRMNRALEGLLIGDDIAYEDFLDIGREYGAGEAELGRYIAQRLGDVSQGLSEDQKTQLVAIRAAYISGQGQLIELEKPRIKLGENEKIELVNTAARFLSWSTGSPEYNDFEVVGKPSQHFGFVSLRVDSNHGVKRGAVANEVRELLTPEQIGALDKAAKHNAERFGAFLEARAKLMRLYETALSGKVIDTQKAVKLGEAVGLIEAEMTWVQAVAMLAVRDLLSEAQTTELIAMRAKYTAAEPAAWSEDVTIRGRQLFAQCALCHNAGSDYAIAPDLTGIVGGKVAGNAAFDNYSPALTAYSKQHKSWTPQALDSFLAAPQDFIEGTFMGYSGLEEAKDRDAIIAYLETQ